MAAKKTISMADLLADSDYQIIVPKRGQSIKGKILSKSNKIITLDINAKTEGVITDEELAMATDFVKDLKVGDEIEAVVTLAENSRGQTLLSVKQAALDNKWDYFNKILDNGEAIEVKGIDVNKGGLIVDAMGMAGFVPSSQFSKQYIGKFRTLKGKKVKVKAIEVDQEKNRLIFSERHVSEAQELAARDQALANVKDGEVYSGIISGVMPFGLFVTVEVPVKENSDEIGYVEGLIHISEISWEKVAHPKDYHQIGDKVKVKVLGVDENTGKLNLSLKQLTDDPWMKIAKDYPAGTTFTGTISRVEAFGIFVNVESGVDGLIHASKLSKQNLKPGDEITVTVESVEPKERRMSLSVVETSVPIGYK